MLAYTSGVFHSLTTWSAFIAKKKVNCSSPFVNGVQLASSN
jgi:hypothetical protein